MSRRFFCLISSCFLFILSNTLSLAGENWPQFRGPTGQGVSTSHGLPLRWSSEENVTWKTEIPGRGWSSPVLVEGRLYLTAAVPVEAATIETVPNEKGPAKENREKKTKVNLSLRAICIDAAAGEILWNRQVFEQVGSTAAKIHGKNSHASPTPLIRDGRLYVHFGHQGTACLTLDGKPIWKNSQLKYSPVHGNGGSPVFIGDHLIFSCDGGKRPFVVALDKSSGKLAWQVYRDVEATKKFSFSTPAVIEVEGKRQLISLGSNVVLALDPATGREIWRVRYDGYSVVPRPVFGHGLVFLSTGFDSPTVMAIRPNGSGDVTDTHVAWTLKRGAPNTPSLLLAGDELVMVSDRGIATCVDARTGKQHYQERIGGSFSASPVLADGRVYLQDEAGKTTVIAAGKEFIKLAENDLKERTLASHAIGDGAIFIRTVGGLYRIDAKSPVR